MTSMIFIIFCLPLKSSETYLYILLWYEQHIVYQKKKKLYDDEKTSLQHC